MYDQTGMSTSSSPMLNQGTAVPQPAPSGCRLAPIDRNPAHDFATLPPGEVYTIFCRQCGEKR